MPRFVDLEVVYLPLKKAVMFIDLLNLESSELQVILE